MGSGLVRTSKPAEMMRGVGLRLILFNSSHELLFLAFSSGALY